MGKTISLNLVIVFLVFTKLVSAGSENGKTMKNSSRDTRTVKENKKVGLIDLNTGEYIVPAEYENVRVMEGRAEKEELYVVTKNGKDGVLGEDGNFILEPIYDRISDRGQNNLPNIIFKSCDSHKNNCLEGLVEPGGNILIQAKYNQITKLEKADIYYVRLGNKKGFVDLHDNIIVEPIYDEMNDLEIISKTKGKFKTVILNKYEVVEFDIPVNIDNKLMNSKVSIKKIKKENGYVFERSDGFRFPKTYDDAWDFKNGKARIKIDGKWGFINIDGNNIGEVKYNYVWDFEGGKAKVRQDDGSITYINENGTEIK